MNNYLRTANRFVGKRHVLLIIHVHMILCRAIFSTCYMATENSSEDTKQRAKKLAEQIGRYILYNDAADAKSLYNAIYIYIM